MTGPDEQLDILPGSRIVRRGQMWRAEIRLSAGRHRTARPVVVTAATPHLAAQRAVSGAWLALLHAQATGGGAAGAEAGYPPPA